MPAYGIIIPVYNAGEQLQILLNQLAAELLQHNLSAAVLVVDDGSVPALKPAQIPGLQLDYLRHTENRGKGAALRSGFSHFLKMKNTRAVISMDGDLQHRPEDLHHFTTAFEAGKGDIIVGRRRRNPKVMPWHRIISNAMTTWIISAMIGQNAYDSQCGYRLYSRRSIETIRPDEERFHMESEFLIRSGWAGFRVASIPIPTIYNGATSAIRNVPDTLNFISLVCKLTIERIRSYV